MVERTHQRRDRATGVKVLLNQHCTCWKRNERPINWLMLNTHVVEGFGTGCKHCALKTIPPVCMWDRECARHILKAVHDPVCITEQRRAELSQSLAVLICHISHISQSGWDFSIYMLFSLPWNYRKVPFWNSNRRKKIAHFPFFLTIKDSMKIIVHLKIFSKVLRHL